jgi:hypothetical protein
MVDPAGHFVTIFPEMGHSIFAWIEPMRKALP